MAKKGVKAATAAPAKKTVAYTKAKKDSDKRKSNEPSVEEIIEDAEEEELEDEEEEDSESGSDDEEGGVDFSKINDINDSDSDSEIEDDDENENDVSKLSNGKEAGSESDSEEDDDSEEEDIDMDELDLDDLDEESKEELKASTRVRQTINNKDALLASLRRIALDTNPKTVPFKFHQSIVSSKPTESAIESVEDELQRELAFLDQSLEAARQARTLLRKEGVSFTRPTDYFAETLRSDETMEKVKAKLIEEATAKKASAEARKQRDLKKFGKQVQIQKQQERAKEKRETLEKINLLKRKRSEGGASALGAREADDLFDVAVDNELGNSHKSAGNKGGKKRSAGDHGPPNAKRQKKDQKYGFGGKKKFSKSNDATSSGDVSEFSSKRMKKGGGAGNGKKFQKAARPGKDRRKAQAGRR
ncbi:eukaryotic rRNA processing protein EBP2-domain-containing protein [Podospora fimiseda]|uniref:Eukaryotic rRNA processing protein EBP2-domain-containing protein n=1 Tax=Podospora fimiseda TaxID=252190 RepID=A0AAN7H0X6_9PEZI|nr:eukaryotic rRNA processing protein EBP2-domain-containing protein [Podospora fimiseda]